MRVSSLISSPYRVALSEWVRKLAVHFWIQSSVLASFPTPSGEAAYPFKAARTADFNLGQWLAYVVFSRYFFYPLDAMFEDFVFLANVPPVVSSILFQVFFFH